MPTVKIQGLLLLMLLAFAGCHTTCNQTEKRFTALNNPGFTYHQDTLYLNRELYSGYVYALHAPGDTAFIKQFYQGIENGITRIWYPGKQLAEERFYEEGRKSATHRGWWPNGTLKFRYEFKDGEFNGSVAEWYETGKKFKHFHYSEGHEEGSQQMWWINGKVRSNYIIKNGRRYGLLGTKNCINEADSIFSRL